MRNLDLETFKICEDNTVLATGVVTEPSLNEGATRWVAVKGRVNDWTIYYGLEQNSIPFIRDRGKKISSVNIIENLVPCTNEVLLLYKL